MKIRSIVAGVLGLAFLVVGAPATRALSVERHYELVSPPFKAGFGVNLELPIAAATDGEALAFFSNGAFAEIPASVNFDLGYVARRGVSGWVTSAVAAPLPLVAHPGSGGGDMTTSLDRVLEMGKPGPEADHFSAEEDIVTHASQLPDIIAEWEHDAAFTVAVSKPGESFVPIYYTADAGLCLAVVSTTGTEPLVPEANGLSGREVYQVGLGCNGHSKPIELVGVNNQGKLMSECTVTLGSASTEKYSLATEDYFNAVSSDGREIFFTDCTSGSGEATQTLPHQLFVRLDGGLTLEVSRPAKEVCEAGGIPGEVPCAGAQQRASADFEGASEDGSRVYFAAPLAKGQTPLVPGDEDSSRNLYLATIGCTQANPGCAAGERVVTSLVEASHDPNGGQAADVMGVVRVAPDGSRAYFVAGGDLLTVAQQEALEREGKAIPQVGAANLYVFDAATGSTEFIADLCSGANVSGSVEDPRCPSESDARVWTHVSPGNLAQTAGADGEFLVFESFGQLTSSDTNQVRDVYRYDALSGRLNRVSLGEVGFDNNGNRAVFGPGGEPLGAQINIGEKVNNGSSVTAQHGLVTRAIDEEGTRIVFGSAEPLSPLATNGLENAYEWQASSGGEGEVSIVSSGDAEAAVSVERLVISPSGRDVFFGTSQSLVPQDTDVLADVYDARTGSGFPPTPAPVQACSGDACQGPLTSPAPVLVPASAVQQPGGNLEVEPAGKAAKKPSKCRKGFVKKRGGCVKRKAARKSVKSSGRRGR